MPTPAEVIAQLKKLPQDKHILCQVVGEEEDSGAWNMFFEFLDCPTTRLIQLKVYHPDLKRLPQTE